MKYTYAKDKYKVEPGNIHHITNVVKFNIANVERTTASPPCGCKKEDIPNTYVTNYGPVLFTTKNGKRVYCYSRDITGNVILSPGFNCAITKIDSNNELQISAHKSDGASVYEVQDEFELYSGEEDNKPNNAISMRGGIPCTETIKSINGHNSRSIMLDTGPGVVSKVIGDTIYLDLNEQVISGDCEDGCGNMN